MSLSFLSEHTERMWHCLDQGTTSKKDDFVIINGSSNYWGATSKGPALALALFIIYEAGLQFQPSKAFNWLITPSATQKYKRNTISDPHRGTLSDKPTKVCVTQQNHIFYSSARQDIYHYLNFDWKKKVQFIKNKSKQAGEICMSLKNLLNSCAATLKSW